MQLNNKKPRKIQLRHDEFGATHTTKKKHKLKATVGGKTQVKIITHDHHIPQKKRDQMGLKISKKKAPFHSQKTLTEPTRHPHHCASPKFTQTKKGP